MAIITGTGSFIPHTKILNANFLSNTFYETDGGVVQKDNANITEKFSAITGIRERRYAEPEQLASSLGIIAAERAIEAAGISKESLDYIIVAHNFGDVTSGSNRVNIVPSIASKIKAGLKISNPDCIAYDLAFGCPGWVEGLIQANYYLRSGDAQRCMVIGTETLSRVIDPHDRDSMIFSDGAGAAILERSDITSLGILAHKTQTFALEYAELINMNTSNSPTADRSNIYIKMNGRKVYEFALTHVPLVIKAALDKAGLHIDDVKLVLTHQANEKMNNAIGERLLNLYSSKGSVKDIMPLTVGFLGNSSVASVPTLLDMILKGDIEKHKIVKGDKIVFASVGAGMNINAIVYGF
jgi:3-oxoacyl-[acyl-carrier-protein] synthase-3